MGWTVIAFCQIDKESLIEFLENHITQLLSEAGARNIENRKGFIEFELTGQGSVDYSVMDRIKKILLKRNVAFEMSSCEFVEAVGEGYYFNSEDEE